MVGAQIGNEGIGIKSARQKDVERRGVEAVDGSTVNGKIFVLLIVLSFISFTVNYTKYICFQMAYDYSF